MQELHNLQITELVDLLSQQTSVVTKMVHERRFDDDYEKQKLFLKAIQTEIDFRNNTADIVSTDVTPPPDFS